MSTSTIIWCIAGITIGACVGMWVGALAAMWSLSAWDRFKERRWLKQYERSQGR